MYRNYRYKITRKINLFKGKQQNSVGKKASNTFFCSNVSKWWFASSSWSELGDNLERSVQVDEALGLAVGFLLERGLRPAGPFFLRVAGNVMQPEPHCLILIEGLERILLKIRKTWKKFHRIYCHTKMCSILKTVLDFQLIQFNPFLPTGQFFCPQVNYFNSMLDWYFIHLSAVLMFLYVEQDVNLA